MRILRPVFFTFLALTGAISIHADEFEKLTFSPSSGDDLRYALRKPSAQKTDEKLPLVITLHGVGGRGKASWEKNCYANTVLAKPEMRKRYPCFVVAPNTDRGETWWNTKGLSGKERLPDVFELIEKLLGEFSIDPARVYVTGQSMGGFGTFGAIGGRPDLFAASAPVCGGYDPEKAGKIAKLPIWIFHGAKDTTVPVKRSQEMVDALKKAGGEPIYTEFPNVAHNAWTPAYDDPKLWEWLFKQRRG